MNQQHKKKRRWKGRVHPLKWVIWTLAVTFLFYEYFIRVTPSVLVPELMKSFNIRAAQVGILSSAYLYAYAIMQIPVGALADRYGARRLLTFACALCAIGGVLFGVTNHLLVGAAGRFLMGLGSSFGFIGLLYVSTHWFPQKKWALLIALGNAIGMCGAVCGEGPLSLAVSKWTWRPVTLTIAMIAVGIGLLVYLAVRNEPKIEGEQEKQHIPFWRGLKIIARNRQTWYISITSGIYMLITSTFGALWAVPFFESLYNLPRHVAGFASSMVYLGFVIGGPFFGYLSDKLKHRKHLISVLMVLTILTMLPLIYYHKLTTLDIFILTFAIGFFSSGQILTYVFCMEANPVELKATSAGFVNACCFVVGSVLQPVIGLFLDLNWSGKILGGIPQYSSQDYTLAFTLFPILLTLGLIIHFFSREEKKLVTLNDVIRDQRQ